MIDVVPHSTGVGDTDRGMLFISNRGLVTTDSVHAEIHEGEGFRYHAILGQIANDASVYLLVCPSGKAIHADLLVGSEGKSEVYFRQYQLASGQAMINVSGVNAYRGMSDYHTPVLYTGLASSGFNPVLLSSRIVFGGTGPFAPGGEASTRNEWILHPSGRYVIEIKNKAGSPKDVNIGLDWYE
jgi:hypothetical protein